LLVARGIAPQRIRTKGYGPKFPVVENDTAAGRQQNRRVEVVVLNEGATADGSTR
jgi:outer membrane protein OmpA-like peptidoglycan-associated protein